MLGKRIVTSFLQRVPMGARGVQTARVANRGSIKVELAEGKEYWFCRCDESLKTNCRIGFAVTAKVFGKVCQFTLAHYEALTTDL